MTFRNKSSGIVSRLAQASTAQTPSTQASSARTPSASSACMALEAGCSRGQRLGNLWGESTGYPLQEARERFVPRGDALRFGLIGQQCELEGHLGTVPWAPWPWAWLPGLRSSWAPAGSVRMPRKNSVFGGIMTLGVAFGVGHGHDAAAMLLPKAVAVGSAASIAANIRDCESISWSQHSQLAQPGRVSRSWFSLLRAAGQMQKCVRKSGGGGVGRRRVGPFSLSTSRCACKKTVRTF